MLTIISVIDTILQITLLQRGQMSSQKITQKDVFEASEEIKASGNYPSPNKIRDLLGSGSLTTISKHLKDWKEQDSKGTNQEVLDFGKILENVDTETISEFFSNEHPQVIALVFSYLTPKKVASILKQFPTTLRDDILDRMEHMGFVQTQFVQAIAKVLQKELKEIANLHGEQKGGESFVKQVKKELTTREQ